ncbi:hypothetical protein L6Q96_03095 [Candidatus Binatia bacterium]|nr:hypothetical protein [Candidatus Binatia bacterium]
MAPCQRMRAPIVICALAGFLGSAGAFGAPAAGQFGPQGVVREFCQLDGMGQRVTMPGWSKLAPLVGWTLEPAWDRVVVVASYVVGPPRPIDGSTALAIDVQYSVVGEISAAGFRAEPALETLTLMVDAPGSGSWRILGPPPPPHLFADRIDVAEMRASLTHGSARFVPDSLFVRGMFQAAGWQIPHLPVAELLSSRAFRTVDKPAAGDVVVYLDGEQPYHLGILAGTDAVVSSTINAGFVRAPVGAFPGEVRYSRLVGLPGVVARDDEGVSRELRRRRPGMGLDPSPPAGPTTGPTPTAGRPRGEETR